MIKGFKCKDTERLFRHQSVQRFGTVERIALRKLKYLDSAKYLSDLRSPPGNKLEALKGNRRGQHSIRINDQWRICFKWEEETASDVEIVDYHK